MQPSRTTPERDRAVLLGVNSGDLSWSPEESLDELERLAETAGAEVVARVVQQLRHPSPSSYLGKGKIRELLNEKSTLRFTAIIADDELSPAQQRYLEEVLETQVLDRTAVILHIFSQHAHSREGRLQVELAQYRYRLPRLSGRGVELSRLGAGINTRGPGETKLEADRRRIRTRISELNTEIERVRGVRSLHRRQRRAAGTPVVALAGYTNAGKSTLMNALTGSDVLSSDQLFATLDPTTRRLELPNHQEALVTDTVGFIQKLPTDLVAAFRATLEEITEADVIVHVVDAADAQTEQQAEAVEDELEALGVQDRVRITALNKADIVTPDRLRALTRIFPSPVVVSARTGSGLDDLRERIALQIAASLIPVRVRIPYAEAELVNLFRVRGMVEREDHQAEGTLIEGRLPSALVPSFQSYIARK